MALWSIILLVVGALFVVLELHIPGTVGFGVVGALLFVASAVITIMFVPMGIFVVAAETLILGGVIYGAVKYIRSHQLYGKLILNDTLGHPVPEFDNYAFFESKVGVAKTALKPHGLVLIDGATVDAWADGTYISENSPVEVVSVKRKKIIVRKIGQ